MPAGRRTTRNVNPPVAPRRVISPSESALPTAAWPAVSGSWQKSTVGASRRSAWAWSSVSAVPIEQTDSGTPAWCAAITSV